MNDKILAKIHPSGFRLSDSNFYSLNVLDDGDIYYTLCSHNIDTHGRIYRYNPETDTVSLFADLGVITGEAGKKTLPHGKSHSPIFEVEGKIYFATHYGFYSENENKEEPAPPPQGYSPYPGGKIIEFDKSTGEFTILAGAPSEEGIVTMNMDVQRKIIYCLTWPKGIFMYYDICKKELKIIGQVSLGGEVGIGDNYLCICRDFAIDPSDGTVYFTNADGEILQFNVNIGKVETVTWAHMRKDVFGSWDPHKGGHQGYNWRKMVWNPRYERFFGVHPKSAYLFSFDPKEEKMEVLDRICGEYCRTNGLFEDFRYGYLTLAADLRDLEILYYISGFCKDELSYLVLISYHIPTGTYTDHGTILLEDGRFPTLTQSVAIHPNGRIYTCPWLEKPGRKSDEPVQQSCDLISFAKPEKRR